MKTKNIHDIQLHWFILIDTVNHSFINNYDRSNKE